MKTLKEIAENIINNQTIIDKLSRDLEIEGFYSSPSDEIQNNCIYIVLEEDGEDFDRLKRFIKKWIKINYEGKLDMLDTEKKWDKYGLGDEYVEDYLVLKILK